MLNDESAATKVILSTRLRLRPWEERDAAAALTIFTAPAVVPWMASAFDPPSTLAGMSSQLVAWGEQTRGSGGCVGHWAVTDRTNGAVIGSATLQFNPHGGTDLILGWALAPQAWGSGYAAEAGAALVRWAIHERGAAQIFAIVQSHNSRAVATAERMGMQWVTDLGRVPGHVYRVYRLRHADLGLDEDGRPHD